MDANKAKITTIIPTYKRPKLLKRTIASVLAQTYPFLEVCIYDNASNDETKDIVMAFVRQDPRVKYHCHSQNIGSGPNFQYGLSRVETPLFSFLSDDDFLLPWFYENAMGAFERFPEGAFFAGSLLYVTEKKRVVKVGIATDEEEIFLSNTTAIERMMQGTFPLWTSVVFRKKVKEAIGSLDLNVGPFDSDFLLRTAAHFPGIASNQICALFLRHSSSFSVAPELSFVWPGWKAMINRFMQEESLPQHIRLEGEKRMHQNVRKMLYLVLLTSIAKKNFSQAQESVELLQGLYGHKTFKKAILLIIKSCNRYDLLQKGFVFLLNSLFWMKETLKKIKWQKKYGKFAQYLE